MNAIFEASTDFDIDQHQRRDFPSVGRDGTESISGPDSAGIPGLLVAFQSPGISRKVLAKRNLKETRGFSE